MGCVQSSGIDEEAKARNDEIENQLKRDRMMAKNEIKMLLLGAGESGKSTVLKQMKLIHLDGYNAQERDAYKEIIFSNTIQSMRAILEAMPQLDISLSPQNDARRSTILSLPPQIEADVLPRDVADAVRGLWRDPGVKEAVRRSREFQLNDSAVYYFNSIDRMAAPEYLPTDQDILRSRVKTTGITETTFKVGELMYKLFDNVTALVFLVSLSEYDQMLYEDESVNRMQEALTLFDSICNSRWFVKTSIILFLNKIDLFAEKLPRSPLGDYFPDYTGGDNYDAACDYLLHRFVSLNQSAATKQIYAHYTCATDTQQIKFVLSAIQDILLQLHPPRVRLALDLCRHLLRLTTMSIDVLVFGLGAVGSVYAFILQSGKQARVSVVARSNGAAIREKGLNIRSRKFGDYDGVRFDAVYTSCEEAARSGRVFSYVFCANKAILDASPSMVELLTPVVGPETTIFLIQNGFGVEDLLHAAFPKNTVVTSVGWTGARYRPDGAVELFTRTDSLVVGVDWNTGPGLSKERQQRDVKGLGELLAKSGATFTVKEDVRADRWMKLVWNAAWNTLIALTLMRTSDFIRTLDQAEVVARSIFSEVIAVGKAKGLELPHDALEGEMRKYRTMKGANSSMLVDVQRKTPTEVEAIVGYPMREGQRLGVAVPTLVTIYALLKAVDWRHANPDAARL
ncbi:G-protein alpha subunit [Mycena kentingensis (nom. inval.)]|nr:G-protein alpha subunit [Mycena kentingensis (nom. inval.)]